MRRRRDKRPPTAFEKKVYAAVSLIPPGETRPYKWVARKIGRARAYRAVGNALNRNPYIGTVPCHRVIKSDGSPGGFAKGPAHKLKLLKADGGPSALRPSAAIVWPPSGGVFRGNAR